jgi:hypothetical protein
MLESTGRKGDLGQGIERENTDRGLKCKANKAKGGLVNVI